MAKVLLLDGYNLMHRARHGFKRGDHSTIFGFFRSLRPLIEKFNPDEAYFIIEGYPKKRMKMLPEYKGTRVHTDKDDFQRQKRYIINLLKDSFPLTVVRHPDHECDDVLANLIRYRHPSDECIVVSSDTDFIQLYDSHTNVEIYNPIKKAFVPKPDYDYVTWKSLKGDGSDNISGFYGIGDKRAASLASSKERLDTFLSESVENYELFKRNFKLISFFDLEDEMDMLEVSPPAHDWDNVRKQFSEMEFYSITNDKSWDKFVTTFKNL